MGRLLADGKPDLRFGTDGWTALRPPDSLAVSAAQPNDPEATAVLRMPSGDLYVSGNNGIAHCCVQSLVTELSPSGQILTSFGSNGWAKVFEPGVYNTTLLSVPNGLLVAGTVVFGGCGGPVLTLLSSHGQPEPFGAAGSTSLSLSPPGALFSAAVYPRPDGGIGIVGNFNPDCDGSQGGFGLNEGLTSDGSHDPSFGSGGEVHFSDDGAWWVWAVPTPAGGVVLATEVIPERSPFIPERMDLREFLRNGSPDHHFGSAGLEPFNLGQASHMAQYPNIAVIAGPGNVFVVLIGSARLTEIFRILE